MSYQMIAFSVILESIAFRSSFLNWEDKQDKIRFLGGADKREKKDKQGAKWICAARIGKFTVRNCNVDASVSRTDFVK